MYYTKCQRCNRPLKDPVSMKIGMGAICRRKAAAEAKQEQAGMEDKYDLPLNDNMDIECRREGIRTDRDGAGYRKHFNISQMVTVHSPTGMEWGYGGSGPADFALNIMEMFARRVYRQKPTVKLGNALDSYVTPLGAALYQDFKREFVAALPEMGGTIKGDDIRNWIAAHMPSESQLELLCC